MSDKLIERVVILKTKVLPAQRFGNLLLTRLSLISWYMISFTRNLPQTLQYTLLPDNLEVVPYNYHVGSRLCTRVDTSLANHICSMIDSPEVDACKGILVP